MAASFLKRKPKEPDGPQRQEIPVLEADAETGLSAAQAQERLDGGWGNAPVESPGASVREIIAKNVFTYFNFLFFLLAGCVIAVRQWLNLTFLGPVFCNMFIGIVQDLRVKKKVDGLKIMAAPKCRAVRDGQTVELDAAQLVRDDIAVFSPGDQIPADAVVAAGECRVNEALVTGEADEIHLVYQHFDSVLHQTPTHWQLLPAAPEADAPAANNNYLFVPDAQTVLDNVLELYLNNTVYAVMLEARVGEHAARMTAMTAATDSTAELIEDLNLEFNRARQAAITTEISEIVGGSAALKKSDKSD